MTVHHTRIGMGSDAGDDRKTARAYVLHHCLGWVSGMRKPCVLQHSVGLGVPGACPDVARAVFCSICLGLGAGDVRKPCVLQHFVGLGVPGACQGLGVPGACQKCSQGCVSCSMCLGSGAGVCENHLFCCILLDWVCPGHAKM